MYLTYKNASLANFFLNLIEETLEITTLWTKHTTACDLPYAIKETLAVQYRISQWYDCRRGGQVLYLVVQHDNARDITTYALYGVDGRQATRLKFTTEYPGALDVLNILALQVMKNAKPDSQEAVDAFLAKTTQAEREAELLDAVANFEEDD